MADHHCDVVVIGAGIIGASTAYHLAKRGLNVTVVESFAGPAQGSTGLSFSSIRGQWADDMNIELSWRSLLAFRSFPDEHGIDVGYRPSGYLFLVPRERWDTHLAGVELQRRQGVPVDILDVDAAQQITPFNPDGIAGATWGPADGVVDGHSVASAYLGLARELGSTVLYGHPVTAIEQHDTTQRWTITTPHCTIDAQHIVNAAGGWSADVAALAGLRVPVVHSKRNIFATAPGATSHELPMTIDVATGAYLRSEGPRLLLGGARPDQPDGYDLTVDWDWMETVFQLALPRFPWLEDVPIDRTACWAGTYENTPDHQGILGPDPTATTWINACGFSGHGLMQGPEIGRLVAEHVVDGAITSIDISALCLERFAVPNQSTNLGMVF